MTRNYKLIGILLAAVAIFLIAFGAVSLRESMGTAHQYDTCVHCTGEYDCIDVLADSEEI